MTNTWTRSANATAGGSSACARILHDGLDVDAPMPAGAFYLWVPAPGADAWVAHQATSR